MSPRQDKLTHLDMLDEARHRELFKFVGSIGLVASFGWSMALFILGAQEIAVWALIASVGVVVGLALSNSNRPIAAAHALTGTGLVAITIGATMVHPSANMPALLIVIVLLAFLLFYGREGRWHAISYVIVCLLAGLGLNYFVDRNATGFIVDQEMAETYLSSWIIFTVLVVVGLQSGYFYFSGLIKGESLRAAVGEAEAANDAKSNFLASMSHEIRTPMNGVVGMVELLLKKNPDKEQEELLKTARDSSYALLRIIDDILDTSRLEAGKMELKESPTDLVELLEGVLDTVKPIAWAKGVTVAIATDRDVPAHVLVDAGRLRQVLLNILGNAIKFSRFADGTSAEKVDINVRHLPDGWTCFAVRDFGIGMTPETLETLFTPFTQYEDAINTRFGGSGLGLSISHKLVEMMGGRIEVESAPGNGSTFTVFLQLKSAPVPQAPAPVAAPQEAATGKEDFTVLVVEDNEINQVVIGRQLENLGYASDVAGNGAEGLEKWRTGGFDLILADCHMPVMNGFEMVEAIRSEEAGTGSHIPIIAVTANALEGEAERCYAAGMDDYLSKPVKLEDLSAHLAKWLEPGE